MPINRRRAFSFLIKWLCSLSAVLTSLLLILIVGSIALQAIPALSWQFFTNIDLPGPNRGIANAIVGTILLSLTSTLIAAPVAIGTAIYLQKYTKDTAPIRAVRFMIDVLSGTPAIVLGILGLFFFAYYLKPVSGGFSMIAGMMALAILIIPVIERATEEAIKVVPYFLEEGSYALGATKWDTIRCVVIPMAMSGIITGVILAIGRAAEESAVVYLTAGYSQFIPDVGIEKNTQMLLGVSIYPLNERIGTLPINIYNSYNMPNIPVSNAFAAALTLIVVIMFINAAARLILYGPGLLASLRRFSRIAPRMTVPVKDDTPLLSKMMPNAQLRSVGTNVAQDGGSLVQPLTPVKYTPGTSSDVNSLALENNRSIYSPEATNKSQGIAIETVATMPDAPLSNNTSKSQVKFELAPPAYDKENEDDKIKKFVKWFTTDPKKDDAKKNNAPDQAVDNISASTITHEDQTSTSKQASSVIEIIPASIPRNKVHTNPNLEIIPPKNGPLIAGTETDPDPNFIIYTPQSPPSLSEVRETLGPKGNKDKKVGDIVKWFTTDPKKEAKKVKTMEVSGAIAVPGTTIGNDNAANASLSKLYGTKGESATSGNGDNSAAIANHKKSPFTMPNIFGTGALKQKNNNEMPEFNVGKLSQPSLEGSIRDTDFTYAIDPPFQYVRIFFDGEELVYNVLEPVLSDGQKRYMAIIERGLEKLISSKIVAISPEERENFLRQKFDEIIDLYRWNLSAEYRDRMFYHLRKRYLSYDRIDAIMKDHFIEDISCNGPNAYVYIFHRIYGSVRTNISYGDVELNKFVMRLAQISGRHISILQPIKDISLPDGSRANLTLGTEVTKKGATFTIRKFKDRPISPIELLDYSSIDARALAYLWTLLDYKRSILVSGGTASGKTTLMNALCTFIRPEMKIVSLEDTPELNLVHPNWIQSVTRSGFGAESSGGAESISGVSGISAKSPGNIGLYDLLVAALRQRPEYIIVGEVRGAEAFTLFQAIAVGHACMGTIHAGNMRELISRVESNPMNVPRTLFSAMDVVCFSAMIRKGDRNVRRVMQIVEILELDTEGNLITNPVFRWDAVSDRFVFTGKSHIFEKIEMQLGIREDVLIKEMDTRANFLKGLRDNDIRDYTSVVEQIREYELNKLIGSETP